MTVAAMAMAAALTCALTWAFASMAFARLMRDHAGVQPQALNLLKSVVALPFLLAAGFAVSSTWPTFDNRTMGFLVASALLGLVASDTLYFVALRRLGAARAVLFIPLVPVSTTVLAALLLAEPLSPRQLGGVALTLAGVVAALWNPQALSSSPLTAAPTSAAATTAWWGIGAGALYALVQATANVATKRVLNEAEALPVAVWRLTLGAAGLFVVSAATRALPGLAPLLRGRALVAVVVVTLVGTVLGLWLGMVATKGLPVAVATTLAGTTPLWAAALARVFGEKVSLRAAVGAALAVAGVVLLAGA